MSVFRFKFCILIVSVMEGFSHIRCSKFSFFHISQPSARVSLQSSAVEVWPTIFIRIWRYTPFQRFRYSFITTHLLFLGKSSCGLWIKYKTSNMRKSNFQAGFNFGLNSRGRIIRYPPFRYMSLCLTCSV